MLFNFTKDDELFINSYQFCGLWSTVATKMNSSNNLLSFKWSYRRVYQQFTANIRRGWSQPCHRHGSPPAPYIPKALWRGHRRCHAWSPSFAERIPAHNWFEGKSAGSTMCFRILKGNVHGVLYLSFNRSMFHRFLPMSKVQSRSCS